MGSLARRFPHVLVLALVLAPAVAAAQGATPAPAPPPPGGGGAVAPAPAPAGSGTAPAADEKKGEVGGFTFSDKPARRGPATAHRAVRRTGGPLATFPGFEQLPDGGSRFFVQLSQTVPVEERRAQGSITYVLKGAHLRVHNDSHSLVTVHFNTPVFRASLTPSGSDLLFILELRSAAVPAFKIQDNQDKTSTLTIDFPKGDFIAGDGSERLPSEQPPTRTTKRAPKGTPNGAPAPAPAGSGNPNGNPGPTP
ncbi:MAG TPA: hypothetical protein VLT33_19135 [Labilithrix sp.]|nr:hypothetical protein [Labilithrix sp.]